MKMDWDKIESLSILDGPCRDELMDSLKYAYDKDVRLNVKFDVEFTERTARFLTVLRITRVGHEDGSGRSFCVEGICRDGDVMHTFVAWYNTRNRTGVIKLGVFL
ncbi:hypothetical protein IKF63_01735 [Candidatus Saccharibacteria bacterium]|nr:hypothetical protein [Candidatus Saccharibacteria bacterium]